MTIKEELEACSNEIKSVDNKLSELLEEIERLKRKKIVKEYLELTKHVLRCVEHKNNLYKKYERLSLEDCDHPIWYYESDEDITNSKERVIKCTCLLCGREKVAKKSLFNNRLIGIQKENIMSYEEARKSYLEYKTKCSENKKVKRFIKKFFPE